jgi:hypothetical protein
LKIRENTDFGEQRLVMFHEDDASSSLELGGGGVSDPPLEDLPAGAEDDGPMARLGLHGSTGIHFSSRSTTIVGPGRGRKKVGVHEVQKPNEYLKENNHRYQLVPIGLSKWSSMYPATVHLKYI